LSASALSAPFIQVAGEAHLAGTLWVQLESGFAPTWGDEFQLLAAAAGVFDAFDDALLPTLPEELAWKLSYGPTSLELHVGLAGDYNGDGAVDAADYVVWRKTLGQTGIGLAADGNANGEIEAGDYVIWSARFGQIPGGGQATKRLPLPVPEPTAALLLIAAAFMLSGNGCRRRARA
jgi:hypothetical protein